MREWMIITSLNVFTSATENVEFPLGPIFFLEMTSAWTDLTPLPGRTFRSGGSSVNSIFNSAYWVAFRM